MAIVIALFSAVLMLPARWLLLKGGVIDAPNSRSSHVLPTVRGGGVVPTAIISLTLVRAAFLEARLSAVVGAFLLLAVVSFVDDMKGLGTRIRFSVHSIAALVGIVCIIHPIELWTPQFAALAVISWVWVVGYTNAFNFMDGIDGIAGMQALVGGAGTALIAAKTGVDQDDIVVQLSMFVSGAVLGFLPFNFPKARVFMGDVGSAPLGFILAFLAVWIAAKTSVWVLPWIGLLHANFILDTAITMSRRALRGEKVWQAHREHFYQRLVRAGQSHTRVTLTEGALQVVVAAMVIAATNTNSVIRVAVGITVVAIWCCYFVYAEKVFQRALRASAIRAPEKLKAES